MMIGQRASAWYLHGPLPADQETFYDLRRMVRGLFAICDLEGVHWNLPKVDSQGDRVDLADSTRWLRSHVLDSVEFALDSGANPDTLFEDFGEEFQGMEFGREDSEEWCRIEARFDGRADDGAWAWSVSVLGEDDSAVWLDKEAMTDREGVQAAIKEAREAIGF